MTFTINYCRVTFTKRCVYCTGAGTIIEVPAIELRIFSGKKKKKKEAALPGFEPRNLHSPDERSNHHATGTAQRSMDYFTILYSLLLIIYPSPSPSPALALALALALAFCHSSASPKVTGAVFLTLPAPLLRYEYH